MMNRVLLIAYLFPPVGGAGVQRITKFTKYLPSAGWLPSVLTVANPSVPVVDHGLESDIPAGTEVRRARTWEPSYAVKSTISAGGPPSGQSGGLLSRSLKGLARRAANLVLQPDPQILWMPCAIRQGRRLLAEIPHSAILATGPPFSSFLVGAALSRQSGLPLVLDYRDEWDISNASWENRRPGRLSLRIQSRMQERVIRHAGALVATTRASAHALERIRVQAGGSARVSCIYNGFDEDDFPIIFSPAWAAEGIYRLVYAGTLWNLTSVEPLVEAVLDLARKRPDLARRLELVFAGRRTGPQQHILSRLEGTPCRLVEYPYLDHGGAVDLIRSADALCVLLSNTPGAERVVPAKVFESMAVGRSILAITPRGETWEILGGYPAAHRYEPFDIARISDHLAAEIQRGRDVAGPDLRGWDRSQFERKYQARQLAEILDAVADRPPSTREPY